MKTKDTFHPKITESDRSSYIEDGRFTKNLFTMVIFSLPVIYLSIILAVFIHEVVGHGLITVLLGGQFTGFGIHLDGLGWANIECADLPMLSKILIFFGGAFSTTVFALLSFTLSIMYRKSRFASLAFLLFAVVSLLDGAPYIFWDAIYLSGVGDFSMVWLLYRSDAMRNVLIGFSGLIMLVGIVGFNFQYYRIASRWLGEGKMIKRKGWISFSLLVFLLQAAAWFSFDWDQLIPGVGLLPSVVGVVIALLTILPLVAYHEERSAQEAWSRSSHARAYIGGAWIVCIGVIFMIKKWLQNGIMFS